MNEKKIEPTQAMVDIVDLADKLMVMDTRDLLRYALNHPDAAGLFKCDHTDYVHVDEAATRVEAAREQGWDDAADWSIHNINDIDAERIRAANPYRRDQELPTKDGSVIVHLEHEANQARDHTGHLNDFHRLTFDEDTQTWYGMDLAGNLRWTTADDIIPGTWKVEEK